MRMTTSKSASPGPTRRDMNSPLQQSGKEVSMPGMGQNVGVNSAIAEFASKYFRYDSRIITSLFVFIHHVMAYFVLPLFVVLEWHLLRGATF